MKDQKEKSILQQIESLELAGVAFIRDYIQFLFDGPIFNTYTLPYVIVKEQTFTSLSSGYCDVLCSIIGSKVISAGEGESEEQIKIEFENDITIMVSLRLEDRVCAEAALLRIDMQLQVW